MATQTSTDQGQTSVDYNYVKNMLKQFPISAANNPVSYQYRLPTIPCLTNIGCQQSSVLPISAANNPVFTYIGCQQFSVLPISPANSQVSYQYRLPKFQCLTNIGLQNVSVLSISAANNPVSYQFRLPTIQCLTNSGCQQSSVLPICDSGSISQDYTL